MTTTDSIWAAAEHLLRRDAEELRESSTSSRDRDDWTGEEEAKADYDEHIAAADALASLSTVAAQPPAPAALLYEHEDGRYAVNPDTAGDPKWHRIGPVDVSALISAPTTKAAPAHPILAKKHTSSKVDYRGLLGQCQSVLHRHGGSGYAEMLRQLEGHMTELGQRWYAGDPAVVDELLQLYCVEHEAREALAAHPAAPAAQGDALDAAFEAVRQRLCGIQRYSFLLADDGGVRRVQDRTGNWIEFDAAHELFDPVAVDAARAAKEGAKHGNPHD